MACSSLIAQGLQIGNVICFRLHASARGKRSTEQLPTRISASVSISEARSSKQDLIGRSVVVIGSEKSGRAAAKLALIRGADSVTILDRNCSRTPLEDEAEFQAISNGRLHSEFGPHKEETVNSCDVLVLSPGVPAMLPVVQSAISKGTVALSELAFAAQSIPSNIPLAAISGTNGKSTVTSFTGQILEQAGISSFVGGNFGTPLSEAAIEFITSKTQPYQALVVEVSSYQMELPGNFKPKAAVILNLTPDHLERHKTMEEYAACKCRMFNQMDKSDIAILPADSTFLRRVFSATKGSGTTAWLGGIPGVQLDSQFRRAIAVVPTTGQEARLYLSGLAPPGNHNRVHAGTAALLALSLNVGVTEQQVQEAIGGLKGLQHRLEIVGVDEKGVTWINDSKSTNVESTLVALAAMEGRQAVVLLGGIAKEGSGGTGLGFSRLNSSLQRQRAVIVYGQSREAIAKELRDSGLQGSLLEADNMISAISLARSVAYSGDVILLSPGCASFDEFRNFEERGEIFKAQHVL